MFKKHNHTYHIHRFKEFDEARVFIEDMSKDEESTLAAIDYMITHKEYYFLLKNLLKNIKSNKINRKMYEYALLSLDKCPKREEEKEIYRQILRTERTAFVEPLIDFLKSCSCELKDFIFSLMDENSPELRKIAIKTLQYCPDKTTDNRIFQLAAKEKNPKVLREIAKYIQLFITDKQKMEEVMQKNPELKTIIKNYIQAG